MFYKPLSRRLLNAGAVISFVLGGALTNASAGTRDVEAVAARAAATVERLHYNASKALVTAAQDEAFEDYFHNDHGARQEKKARIDRVSLAVQDRFHVEEMCLIDPNGAEISRIVGKEVAYDLATDEADAPFFGPGFATEHRKVYTSSIYLSPDAEKWVIAYVTPILVKGEKKSILHYEHSLDAYSSAIMRQAEVMDGNVIIAADTGHVIFDSRVKIAIGRIDGKEELSDYFTNFTLGGHDLNTLVAALPASDGGAAGRVTGPDGAYDVALRKVGRWSVIAWQAL